MIDSQNLLEILERKHSSSRGITFISEKGDRFLSYGDLYQNSLLLLETLLQSGVKAGHELIFQIEDQQTFLTTFWACLAGGIIPVPVTVGKNDEHKLKLFRIWETLNNPILITEDEKQITGLTEFAKKKEAYLKAAEEMTNTVLYAKRDVTGTVPGKVRPSCHNDIAFIQFSSGSTGDPKGVVLTHGNLLHNADAIEQSLEVESSDSSLSWMPLTHDMGIIGYHLTPLLKGVNQYLMPTQLFIRRPLLWIEKASEYKTSFLCSPNFGYHFFLKFYRKEKEYGWDLSSIKMILNGAEPIDPKLSERFMETLAPYGLDKNAICPVYGLAEASLGVTFSPPRSGMNYLTLDREALTVEESIKEVEIDTENGVHCVSVGKPIPYCSVRIANRKDQEVNEGIIGRVQIKGENVTSGYFNNETATNTLFTNDQWLNTGDLGFFQNGNLYITGREKDILFINGQNFYPHDIERVAEEHPEIQLGGIAVCGVYNESLKEEEILVFVLFKKKPAQFAPLAIALKQKINEQTGLDVREIIPIRQIPKTTSGKIQRFMLAKRYQTGEFEATIQAVEQEVSKIEQERTIRQATTENEQALVELWKETLRLKQVGIDDHFFKVGGNSLKAAMLLMKIERKFQVKIDLRQLFQLTTIEKQAAYIETAANLNWQKIPKTEQSDFYPLSSAQKRIYALQQFEEGTTSYNISALVSLEGELDQDRLNQAFHQLIDRHEILRTTFEMRENIPVQIVHDSIDFTVETITCEEQDVETTVKQFIRPFDPAHGPLLRAGLIKQASTVHLLILDMHHIIADGTSMERIREEIQALYAGQTPEPISIQYKDYAQWQNSRLAEPETESEKQFWLDQFQDVPVLNLSTDFQRPAFQSFEGDRILFRIDSKLTESLRQLADKNGGTLFSLLLASWHLLLSKYSGQDDIVIGTSVAGRDHLDLVPLIGMFVNTLALRNNLNREASFNDFLKAVTDNAVTAMSHQRFQFDDLVEALNLKRDMSRNPLFDTMLVFQNMEKTEVGESALKLTTLPWFNEIAKFDLTLFSEETQQGTLAMELEYCVKLFQRESVQAMAHHFEQLLRSIVQNPGQAIESLNILSEEEQNRLLFDYNQTNQSYPSEKRVVDLFEEQVQKAPEKVAIEFEGKTLTYSELNEAANRLAHCLRKEGVTSDTVVGLRMKRSDTVLIALWAVLKAGGAYLPIDPAYPNDRIEYILENSQAPILLVNGENPDSIEFEGKIIDLATLDLERESITNPESINKLNDLAYIIYTSGSTGRPKGVMIEHKGLTNYIWWAEKTYLRGEPMDFPLYTTLSFDLTVTSVFTPLITGNRIVIYQESEDTTQIQQILEENKVDIIKLTPAHLRLVREMNNSNCRVRRLIVGGEQLETGLCRDIHKSFNGKIEIFNEYGPTETVVGCMTHTYSEADDHRVAVPVGVPGDNVSLYLLDQNKIPVPTGVAGEMYISGDGVARGYMNNREKSEEAFMENPFLPGKRMYKTGDLAKWLPDGIMEFIGRVDHQIKIRGYRIEIGEIENALLEIPNVQEAIVLDREDEKGEKFLCSWLVSDGELSKSAVRDFLAGKLPDYMIPSWFLFMDALPLTHNGKLDREALPEPEFIRDETEQYIAPENEIQEKFVTVWERVLGVTPIGVRDSFFALGGDSIKAIQVVSGMAEEEITVSVKEILLHETIERISANLSDPIEQTTWHQGRVEGSVANTPILNWFLEREFPNPGHYNQSVLLDIHQDLDPAMLERAFQKVIDHHDGLRLNYDPEASRFHYANLDHTFTLQVWNYRKDQETEQQEKIEKECAQLKAGLQFNREILLKAAIFDLDEGKQKLFITAHHILVDGVSWRILLEDLFSFYQKLQQGKEPSPLKKTASLKDWADYLTSEEFQATLEPQLPYWQETLQSAFALPRDLSESEEENSQLTLNEELDESTTAKLLYEAHEAYNSDVQDILITALYRAVREWTFQTEILLELENHGRHSDTINTNRTVGWFTVIHPLRLQIESDEIGEQIKVIKEKVRSIPTNGLGFGVLQSQNEELRQLTPKKPEIRFNYLGIFGNETEGDFYSFSPMWTGPESCETNHETVLFDINCMIVADRLRITLGINQKTFGKETGESFLTRYMEQLRSVITHTIGEDDVHFTPSDFAIADIDQNDLDSLFD